MSYNEEKLKEAETVLSFANHGFMNRVREIAEALSICPKDDVKVIAKHLTAAIEAIESVEADVKYYKAQCEKENKI